MRIAFLGLRSSAAGVLATFVLPLSVAVTQSAYAKNAGEEGAVKLSSGGICHESSSAHFERLKKFQRFNTMSECIAAGGRLPVSAQRKEGTRRNAGQEDPDQIFSIGKESMIIAVVAGVALLLAGWLYGKSWYRRRKNQRIESEFRSAQDKRWEGHRLERPEKNK